MSDVRGYAAVSKGTVVSTVEYMGGAGVLIDMLLRIPFATFRNLFHRNPFACQLPDRGAACLAGSLPGTLLTLFFFDEKNRGTSHLLLKATSPSPAASKVCVGRGAVRFLALPHVPASYAPLGI